MITIIDYGAGNLRSLCNALNKIGEECTVIVDAAALKKAERVILPGVGAAAFAMKVLRERGFAEALPQLKIPFLGICVGLQLLSDFSEEGDTDCLSILSGTVKKISAKNYKVPQIGWNRVTFSKPSAITRNIPDGSYFYFVNSYVIKEQPYTLAQSNYGGIFTAIANKNNFYGTQFHPEKSGTIGLQLLKNFCTVC